MSTAPSNDLLDGSATETPPPILPVKLPQLRIHHFLVWTAVLAATFTLLDRSRLYDRNQAYATTAALVVALVVGSAAITCLGFGVAWWWRGLRFPSEPGHWMVIQAGVEGIAMQVALALFAIIRSGMPETEPGGVIPFVPDWTQFLFAWVPGIGSFAFFILNVVIAIRLVQGWRWRLVFAVTAWMYVGSMAIRIAFPLLVRGPTNTGFLAMLPYFNFGISTAPSMLLLIFMSLAVVHDFRNHTTRHWSHWVGVSVWGLAAAVTLISFVSSIWSQ